MNKFILNVADFLGAIMGLVVIIIIAPFVVLLGLINIIWENR